MTKLSILFALPFFLVLACSQSTKTEAGPEDDPSDDVSFALTTALNGAQSQASALSVSSTQIQSIDDEVHAEATCSYLAARTCDNAGTAEVNWDGCTIGSAALTGKILETYSGAGADSSACHIRSTGQVTRKITQDRVLTFTTGATLTTTSNPPTAWDSTTFPSASTGTRIQRVTSGGATALACGAGASACHHVTVNGEETILKGRRGLTLFDHIMTADFYTKGTRVGGNLVIDGTSTIWHQVARYKAVNTMSAVTWGDAGCCYPTSGTISGTVTGSVIGNVSIAFTSTCGGATYTDTTGATSTITLNQCSPQ